MSEREDMGRRLYEACFSGSVAALDVLIEKDQLILDRGNSFTCFLSDTPLHVAVLRGHLDLTKALLFRKPKLATELDSIRCSPLHLASIEGHVQIVQELLQVNTDVCLARDQDGRIPLHLAAIKGRVEVIRELLRAKPESILEKLDRGETVLHLCVKYNRFEALKTLVENLRDNEFLLSSGDDNGNTILHFAAGLKQMDTIKYLLGIKSVKEHCANVKNRNGSTALDVVDHCPNRDLKTMEIREFLLQAGVRRSISDGSDLNPKSSPDDYNPPPPPPPNPPPAPAPAPAPLDIVLKVIVQCISRFWTKYIIFDPLWLKQVCGHLITAATLTATMAYQSILSPPGGFWQETNDNHTAGTAILKDMEGNHSAKYFELNSVMLFASLCTIVLALSGIPQHNKFLLWLMIFTVYVTLTCMAVAYDLASTSLLRSQTKNNHPESRTDSTAVSVGVSSAWIVVIGVVLVLHASHFLVKLGKKFVNLVKRCFYGRRRRRSGPNNHIPQNPDATGNCFIGNYC